MPTEVYTRDCLIELRKTVVQGNRNKYIESVVTYTKEGVIHTVTDTRNNVFIYNAPISSKPMAELLMPEIRAQLKGIFPDLALHVEYAERYPFVSWLCCRVAQWLAIPFIKVTVSW